MLSDASAVNVIKFVLLLAPKATLLNEISERCEICCVASISTTCTAMWGLSTRFVTVSNHPCLVNHESDKHYNGCDHGVFMGSVFDAKN